MVQPRRFLPRHLEDLANPIGKVVTASTARRRLPPARLALASRQSPCLGASPLQRDAGLCQGQRGDSLLLAQEPEQENPGIDITVVELVCLVHRQLEYLLRAGRKR